MKNKIIAVLFCAFCASRGLAGDIEAPKELKDLTEQMFARQPRLTELANNINASEKRVEINNYLYYPTASFAASYVKVYPSSIISIPLGPTLTKDIAVAPDNNYSAILSASQPLIDFKTAIGVDKSKSELETSKDLLENSKSQMAYQMAQLYYNTILLNKSLETQKMQIDLVDSNIEQIKIKIKDGVALDYDLLTFTVRKSNLENAYSETNAQLKKVYNIINMLSGGNGYDFIKESDFNIDEFQIREDEISKIYERNYDIKLANDNIKTANYEIDLAEKTSYPTLNVFGTAGYKNGLMPDINQFKFSYTIGIGASFPILLPSSPSVQKKISEINYDSKKEELDNQKQALKKDILNAREEMSKNITKLKNADDLINQAKEALRLAKDRYKLGAITNLDLLAAQTNYQDAILSKAQCQFGLIISKLEINRLSGEKWWK